MIDDDDDYGLSPALRAPRRYTTIDLDALLTLSTPVADMSVAELKAKIGELKQAYKSQYEHMVSDPYVTNLSRREDRISTAEHHLRRIPMLIEEIKTQLATSKKKSPTAP